MYIVVILCIMVFYGLIIGFIFNKRKCLNFVYGRNLEISVIFSWMLYFDNNLKGKLMLFMKF